MSLFINLLGLFLQNDSKQVKGVIDGNGCLLLILRYRWMALYSESKLYHGIAVWAVLYIQGISRK